MFRLLVLITFLFQCLLPVPQSFALAPKSFFIQIHDKPVWSSLEETKLLLHALFIYRLQISENLSGDDLRRKFSLNLSAQGKALGRREKLLVSGFQWDEFSEGYFPFRIAGNQFVINIFGKGKRPNLNLSKSFAEGELEDNLEFIVFKPFDRKSFFKRILDPKTSLHSVLPDFEWLLSDPTNEKAQILREAFNLIQSLSYMRTADIYRKLKEESRVRLLKILDAQTIGRMLFGMLILDRDEGVKRARQQKEREAEKTLKEAKTLREKANEIRDALDDSKILVMIKSEFEEQIAFLSVELRKIEDKLSLSSKELLELEKQSEADQLQGLGERLLAELDDPKAVELLKIKKLEDLLARESKGEKVQVPPDLESIVQKELEQEKAKARALLERARALRSEETTDYPNTLEELAKPIREQLERSTEEYQTQIEGIRSELTKLKSKEGRAIAIERYRKSEEKRAKSLEFQAGQLEMKAKEIKERPIDALAILAASAKKIMKSVIRFVESVLTTEEDFSADGITQVNVDGQTSFEKFKSLQEVIKHAQMIYLMEQNDLIQDVSLRAARKEVGKLIGVDDAVQFAIQKLLERGRPRFLLLNTTDYQRADAVSGLAVRLFEDETLPVSIRSKKIYKLDLNQIPTKIPDFVDALRGVFTSAQTTGDIVLVIDFNQLRRVFYQHEQVFNAVMESVMAVLEDFTVPVIGWITPENHQALQGKKRYQEFFRKNAFLITVKASDFERVLRTEIEDIENHNQVKFPREVIDKAVLALFVNSKDSVPFSDVEDMVRIFKGIAAEYQAKIGAQNLLDQKIPIHFERIEKEIEAFIAARKKTGSSSTVGSQIDRDYEDEMEDRDLPREVREKVLKEAERLEDMREDSQEAAVVRNYLDWVLSLPWDRRSKEIKDISHVKKVLEEDHYGMEAVHERILEHVAVKIRKEKAKAKGEVMLLYGPPGVGKTSVGKSIAKGLGREFVRFSVGGMRDEAEIRGHRKTYVGAMPGRIIQALRKARTRNPVVMIDEIDKIGHDFRGDPADAFLEVLDPEQNHDFRDHYLELGFDLSEVLFVVNANDISKIPGPLFDRMDPIEIEGYTLEEKLQIAKRHLLPRVLKEYDTTDEEFSITLDALRFIIEYYTREAGVRGLEKKLISLVKKANKEMLETGEKKVVINKQKVPKYLGKPRSENVGKRDKDRVGVVAGLAWTPMGGTLLFCESRLTRLEGQSQGPLSIKLTGSLQNVMKESADVALSVVRDWYERLDVKSEALGGKQLHIHFPSGAVPKDGPSAGITITTALVSILTGLPVDRNVAMTGEVSLTEVLPIGGLKQKILAAYAEGMEKVIIPKRNEKDLEEIPKKILDKLEIIPVDQIEEVWKIAIPGLKERLEALSKKSEESKTKIRRGDPDLTADERETLETKLDLVHYFRLSDSNLPDHYQQIYRQLLMNLKRVGNPYVGINKALDRSFIIRVIEGEMGERLDLGVKDKMVYAYSKGNIIFITKKLLNRMSDFPNLFAALILHELVEILGGTHSDAEKAEFIFGRLGENLSALDLVLLALETLESGVMLEPDAFLETFNVSILNVKSRERAVRLLKSVFADPLSKPQLMELGRSLFSYFATELAAKGTIFLRGDLGVKEQKGFVDAKGVPDVVFSNLMSLGKREIRFIILDGIVNRLESYKSGEVDLNVTLHQGKNGPYLRVALDPPAEEISQYIGVVELNSENEFQNWPSTRIPQRKKVISIDLDLLAEIDSSNPRALKAKPRDWTLDFLTLRQQVKEIKSPELGGSVYDIVLFSKYDGTSEILASIGLSTTDFDSIYSREDLQANAGGVYIHGPIGKDLLSLIESDYAASGVQENANDVILIIPDKDRSSYGSSQSLETLPLVRQLKSDDITELNQSFVSALNLLSNEAPTELNLEFLFQDAEINPVPMANPSAQELISRAA